MEMEVSNTSANNNEAVSLLMDDDDKEKIEGNTCLTFFFYKVLHQAYLLKFSSTNFSS